MLMQYIKYYSLIIKIIIIIMSLLFCLCVCIFVVPSLLLLSDSLSCVLNSVL